MNPPLQIKLSPAAQKLLAALPALPARARAAIVAAVDRENQLAVGVIQQRYLSRRGPDTLGVITNRLRGGVRAAKTELLAGGVIRARIGNNVKYAGVHEFGFDDKVNVKAHVRRILAPRQYTTPRVTIDPVTGHLKFGKARAKKRLTLGTAQVRAHARKMKLPARAPIRRGMQDCLPAYAAAIARALTESLTAQD